ncbi:MAG TPA: hypothetical protein VFN78_13540 [Ktedonobacterales bacterium]|nr:hypothetical protein [Ktedonobacterales bacterium]
MSWQTDTMRVAAPTRTRAPAPIDAKRHPSATRFDWIAGTLAAIAVIVRVWLTLRGWPALDSDEAIVGLMARHILYNGEHPIFYYGQHYMGALEAYLAVPFFWLLGPTQLALRLAMLTLIVPFLVCVYLLGRAAYGRTVGLLVLAALAIGPAYGLMREAPAIGGYQETLLFGALLPLIAYQRLRSPLAPTARGAARRASIAQYAAFGLIAGLGIWSDELILVFIATPLLALALARPRELFWPPVLVALVSGVLIGGAPFIGYNLLRRGQTFVELSVQERSSHLGPHQLLAQIGSTLSLGLPATFGSPQVCVAPGTLYAGYASYPLSLVTQAAASAGCQGIAVANVLFSLVILSIYALAAVPLIRALLAARPWRARLRALLRGNDTPASGALQTPTLPMRAAQPDTAAGRAHVARLWLRGMLVLAALGTLAQYSLSRRGVGPDQFVAIRYLLPLYITLPVLIGPLVDTIRAGVDHVRGRGVQRSARERGRAGSNAARGVGAALASGALALLLALFVMGGALSVMTATDSSRFTLPSVQDQQMMRTLRRLGVSSYYGAYWMCYNLVFESGEQLHCSTYGRVERYHPYAVYLSHTQHPAYVLEVGSVDDATFQQSMAPTLAREGYAHTRVEGFDIYYLPQ